MNQCFLLKEKVTEHGVESFGLPDPFQIEEPLGKLLLLIILVVQVQKARDLEPEESRKHRFDAKFATQRMEYRLHDDTPPGCFKCAINILFGVDNRICTKAFQPSLYLSCIPVVIHQNRNTPRLQRTVSYICPPCGSKVKKMTGPPCDIVENRMARLLLIRHVFTLDQQTKLFGRLPIDGKGCLMGCLPLLRMEITDLLFIKKTLLSPKKSVDRLNKSVSTPVGFFQ